MSVHVSFETGEIIANPDFAGTEAKRHGVFLLDLLSPGPTMPGDLDPHNWEEVHKPIAADVNPVVVQAICKATGIELR